MLLVNCLQRQEEERFKKIDEKRGGRGFVWDEFISISLPRGSTSSCSCYCCAFTVMTQASRSRNCTLFDQLLRCTCARHRLVSPLSYLILVHWHNWPGQQAKVVTRDIFTDCVLTSMWRPRGNLKDAPQRTYSLNPCVTLIFAKGSAHEFHQFELMNGYLPTVILHNSNLDLPFRCLQALIQNISVGCSYVGSGNCECKPSTSHVKLTLKSICAAPGLPSCPTLQWFHPDPIAMAPYALSCFLH